MGGGSLADEIRYAVDHGAAIISMSLSTSQGFTEDRDAVNYALSHNVLLVTASGNEGKPDHIDFPGKFPGVLTVGGVSKSGTIWSGSNYGPEVLLTAPATEIVSAGWPGNTLRIGTGTSTSTAFTSAAAALIKSKFPNLTPGQIANRLVKSATLPESAKGISLPDEKYGYGIINPLMALTKNIPAGSKYGPLKISVPEGSSATPSSGASDTGATKNEKEDQKQMLFFVILGVVALLVVSLIVLLIVKLSRRNKNNNGGPGGRLLTSHMVSSSSRLSRTRTSSRPPRLTASGRRSNRPGHQRTHLIRVSVGAVTTSSSLRPRRCHADRFTLGGRLLSDERGSRTNSQLLSTCRGRDRHRMLPMGHEVRHLAEALGIPVGRSRGGSAAGPRRRGERAGRPACVVSGPCGAQAATRTRQPVPGLLRSVDGRSRL